MNELQGIMLKIVGMEFTKIYFEPNTAQTV